MTNNLVMQNMSPSPLRDEEILAQSLSEPEAFSVLVERYQIPFRQAARRILRSDDAEDAVQETFVRMYIHGKKYVKKKDIKFSAWAYAILVRVCYTIYSRNKKHSTFTLDESVAGELQDFSIKDLREYGFDANYLLSLISKLPALLRRTVELYVFDHKTPKEIARIENVSYGVVRTRLSRARQKLRQLNTDYHGI